MLKPFATALLAAMTLALPGLASADDDAQAVKPMFKALPPHVVDGVTFNAAPGAQLPQWNGSFTDLRNVKRTYVMAGADPSTSNTTTTIQAYLIPLIMVYGASNGNMTFDPTTETTSSGLTVMQQVAKSPIFKASIDYVQGGVDLGKAQYIDAFQRGNFWSSVSTNTDYHTVLQIVKTLKPQTITVSATEGHVVSDPFHLGGPRGEMDINAFDGRLQTFMSKLKQINPSVLPIFITADVFLTGGGCCIGGYHSANGVQPAGQTYSYATYINTAGSFAQDVSALSHEIGEWMDDPFTDNHVGCTDNSLLEVGDPLEREANYGGFPYKVKGFTYNLQSLVFLPYFGAPLSTSVNNWYSFQNDMTHVCPGQ
jgi:hypothetical protein